MSPFCAGLLAIGVAVVSAGMAPAAGSDPAAADANMVFPDDAVIDVCARYGVKGDGTTDDTAAIGRAMAEHTSGILYFRNGTYLISDTLRYPEPQRGLTFQGQSSSGTIIQLKDAADGFGDPAKLRPLVWTGRAPAQRFRNYIRNLTLDTGRGNPGAIGIQFMANNAGGMFDVTIRSGDGSGPIGLDMGYSNEQGPCLIKNVRVIGFDVGVSARHAVDSITFEHLTLQNQRTLAFRNEGQCIAMRDLRVSGNVPAVENLGSNSVMTLIDSTLSAGSPVPSAVRNTGVLFVRNLTTRGYARALESDSGEVAGPVVDEWVSHPVSTLFDTERKSLNLPIQETPDVAWDDPKTWVSVTRFGAGTGDNDAEAIQQAIDSGATTVYFPPLRRPYHLKGTVEIRGNVRRIEGCQSTVELAEQPQAAFRVVDGAAPVVVFENFGHFGWGPTAAIDNASSRTLVVRDCCNCNGRMTGHGDVFIEDVCGSPAGRWLFAGQRVWARHLNVENRGGNPFIENAGGQLWILGYKTENHGTIIQTTGGGATEVLGGFTYALGGEQPSPMFTCRDSSMSVTYGEWHYGGSPATTKHADHPVPYGVLVEQTQDGVTRQLRHGDVAARGDCSAIPLFVARPEQK